MTLGAYSHQEVPFEQVVEVVRPARSLSHSALFQVMFALQNTPQSELELPGLRLSGQGVGVSTAQFDLSLSLQEVGEEIVGGFSYASDLFERSTIERWVGYFTAVLTGLGEGVDQPVSRLSVLGALERE